MVSTSSGGRGGMSRRGFLAGAGVGLVAGAGATWLGVTWQRESERGVRGVEAAAPPRFTGRTREVAKPKYAMPGPFPGRVIEVRHRGSVGPDYRVNAEAVKAMMDRGMTELTGAGHATEAWRRFFEPGDVVGVKVNPVGFSRRREAVSAISSPEVLVRVVEGLKTAGVKARDIIVFERYANEFREAGYEKVLSTRPLEGVRWFASGSGYDDGQLRIDGQDNRRERDPHVAGYDPDVFVQMGFASPGYERDERAFRSHLSLIVSRMVNKIVTIPVLKDHRSAGVTLALKNLSHGMNNNVARSHIGAIYRVGGERSGPNQCNTFIPTAAGQAPLREKATLHILDGLIGVYEGGPGSWNPTWGTWRRGSLFFATDPVAMDHVGWDVIDAVRVARGWQPVARMGQLSQTPAMLLSPRLAVLAARTPLDAAVLSAPSPYYAGNQESEQFDRRQPEHIILAGTIGLGVFDAQWIEHRRIQL